MPLYCCEDPEKTSIIMESLAVETKNDVIPALYEEAILNKYLCDEESIRMVELMQEHRVIDLGDTIWYDPIRNTFMDCFKTGGGNFASAIAKRRTIIQKTIERAIEKLTAVAKS